MESFIYDLYKAIDASKKSEGEKEQESNWVNMSLGDIEKYL